MRLRRLGPATIWRVEEVADGIGSEGRWGAGTTSAKVERRLEDEEVVPMAE